MQEKINQLLAPLKSTFERLTDRERRLLNIFMTVLACIVIGLGYLFFSMSLSSKRTQIHSIHEQMERVHALESEYMLAKVKQEANERKFRTNNVSLFSLLQEVATRLSLQLNDLNEQKQPVENTPLVETSVAVSLKDLSIDKLTAFLEAVEGASDKGLVKVTRLKVRKRYQNPELLEVTMTVSTWKNS